MKLIVTQYANHQARYLPFFFVGQQSVYLLNDLDLVLLLMKNYVCIFIHSHIYRGERERMVPAKLPHHSNGPCILAKFRGLPQEKFTISNIDLMVENNSILKEKCLLAKY